MKQTWLLLIIPFTINASFLDSDYDGVEDSADLCPNTYILDIVDKYGCSVKRAKIKSNNKTNYSLSVSYFYSKDVVTQISYSLNFSASYKNYSGYIETSIYKIDSDSGLDDTTIALFYNFSNKFDYTIGLGAYLPTSSEKDNKTDYFFKFKISYNYKDFDSYISYQKNINRDKETKNSDSYILGLGYKFNKNLYTSISYLQSNSLYINNQNNKYVSIFTNYYINKNIYLSLNYTRGLNSNSVKNSSYLTIGYDF